MTSALSDKLQLWGTIPNTVIYSDGSLGAVLKVDLVDAEFWPDTEINSLAERIRSFLNALPENTDIQFLKEITATPDARINGQTPSGLNGLLESLSAGRQALFQMMNSTGTLPEHSLLVVIRRPLSSPLIGRPKMFGKSKMYREISESELKRAEAVFQKDVSGVSDGLTGLGLKTRRFSEGEIAERTYREWNPDRNVSLGRYDTEDLRDSLLFTDAVIHPRGFLLGATDHRVISLKLLPEQTHAGMAGVLSELPYGSQVYLSVHVPQQSKELESLQTQRRLAFSLVHGRPGRVRDIDSEAKLEDLEQVIEDLVQASEKIFRLSFNIVLRSSDPEELDSDVARCLAKVRELAGAEAMVETVAAFDIFSDVVFPNARSTERQKRLKTSNLADFIPVQGSWHGHETAAAQFRSRTGSLVGFDPFASELTNANQLISGASGSGKSYLTNNLLLQFLKDDPKIFIIDIGGSYKKLCTSLGGQYIPLGVGSALSLNPFDLAEGEEKPSEQKIKFLVGLVETMTKEHESTGLPRLERAELEGAIIGLYSIHKEPTLTDLKMSLAGHEHPRMQMISKILAQWTGDSPFGQFLDRKTSMSLERRLICFDLKGLETHPDLQAACLFVITDLIWRSVQADRSSKKYLIFDECWRILETPAGASLVGDVFRTFRKYYASAIAISQTIDDFARSTVAHAIIPNSSVKWLMKQKGSNKENLKQILGLNDHELGVIDSLQQERGSFSEAFLMAGDRRSVVRIESTALEYWIATTDPRDLAQVDIETQKEPETATIDILKRLAVRYPAGVAANTGGSQ